MPRKCTKESIYLALQPPHCCAGASASGVMNFLSKIPRSKIKGPTPAGWTGVSNCGSKSGRAMERFVGKMWVAGKCGEESLASNSVHDILMTLPTRSLM